jgi:hypothetical protein
MMSKMAENIEWEKEAPELAKLPKSNPFSVPNAYFVSLTERINQTVFINTISEDKDAGFSTPPDYFKHLEEQLVSRISIENLENKKNNQGFAVPENYFEKLQSTIAAKTVEMKPITKVVRLWNTDFFKYATAACIVLMCALGLYVNQQHQVKQLAHNELTKEQLLYDIDESLIIEHINETQTATAAKISNNEIEDYILDNFSTADLSNNL